MDSGLICLYEAGEITYDTALTNFSDPRLFSERYKARADRPDSAAFRRCRTLPRAPLTRTDRRA